MRGLAAVALLATSFVIARLYPPGEAAGFFFILTAAQISTPLLLLGFNGFLLQQAPRFADPGARRIWFGHCLFAVVIPAALSALVMAGLALRDGQGAGPGAATGWSGWIYILFLAPLTGFAGYTLQALGHVAQAILVLQLLNTLLIGLLAGLAPALALPAALARDLVFPLAGGLGLGLSQLLLHRAGLRGGLWPRLLRHPAELLQGESPAALALIWAVYAMLMLTLWLPQLVFYAFASREDFAFFSLAQRLGAVVVFFSLVTNFTLAPRLARLWAEGARGQLRRLLLRSCLIPGALALPLVLLLLLLPREILGIFGADYVAGSRYLQIFALSQFLAVLSGAANTLLVMAGAARLLLQDLALGGLVALGLIALLGSWLGGTGFALAFAAGLGLQSLLALRHAFLLLREDQGLCAAPRS